MTTLALNSAFYKEHVGRDNLQRTFQSNQVFTPKKIDRCTISEDNFKRYFNANPRATKTPWGRSLSYGGLGPVNLPRGSRPKGEPPIRVEKGHLHYGAGVMPHPSCMTTRQFYTLTSLSKSRVRSNDELVPAPNKENIAKSATGKKFPAEHPFSSHSSRFMLFPQFDTPTDMYKGEPDHILQPTLPPETPAAAPDTKIVGKSRGSPARHEQLPFSRNSARSPLRWLDGPNFFQVPKGSSASKQIYYPIPPSTVRPASGAVLENNAVSLNTASALNGIQKSFWISTYGKDFQNHTNVESERKPSGMSKTNGLDSMPVASYTPFASSESRPSSSQSRTCFESTDKCQTGGLESKKTSEPSTPKSVQFSRSVTFSDGTSIREIPLTSGSDANEGNKIFVPKTPFSRSHQWQTANSEPTLGVAQDEVEIGSRSAKGAQTETSFNPMPSQANPKETRGDPNGALKYFRPHTVGSYRSSTELLKARDSWSKSTASREFHGRYPEPTPDLRRKPDLRFTSNEKRHVVPEANAHTYIFRGADHL